MYFAKDLKAAGVLETSIHGIVDAMLTRSLDGLEQAKVWKTLEEFVSAWTYHNTWYERSQVLTALQALTCPRELSFKVKGIRYFTVKDEFRTQLVRINKGLTNTVICVYDPESGGTYEQVCPVFNEFKSNFPFSWSYPDLDKYQATREMMYNARDHYSVDFMIKAVHKNLNPYKFPIENSWADKIWESVPRDFFANWEEHINNGNVLTLDDILNAR